MQKKTYVLTYDHGGYVLWKNAVKPRLQKIAVWLEKYPDLKMGLDYESFAFDEFSREDPEVVDMIASLLEKHPDRLGLGATTYGQPLSLCISEESNARQLSMAVKTNLRFFGKTPSVYAISEFALNNQTPQLIKLCGYRAAILRSHVMGYGYTRTFDCAWGKWIGKDGTEIPAVPTYDGEGQGFNCTTVDNWILSRWPADSTMYSPDDFSKMFSKYTPLLASRYDDLLQPLEPIAEHAEKSGDFQFILLEEIPKIYGKAEDELRTTDNDFHVQMPWGYCGNEIFNGCRASEVAVVEAEKLNALSVLLGAKPMQNKLEEAWQYALAAQHHDIVICGLLDLARRFIPMSLKASETVKEASQKALAAHFADPNGEALLIINPNSFGVDEWVEAEVDSNVSAFDGDTALESEVLTSNGVPRLRVHVKASPFEMKRLTLRSAVKMNGSGFSWSPETGELVTPLYILRLTEQGIASLAERKSGQKLIDNGDGALFSACVEDKDCLSSGTWKVTLSAFGAAAVQTGTIGGIPFSFEMRFSGMSARIDCKTRFEMNGEHVGRVGENRGLKKSETVNGNHHEDKLCFVMNACLKNDRRMVRDLPYSIADWDGELRVPENYWYTDDLVLADHKATPEESFLSTTYMHCIYWLCLHDSEKGIAVFNRGCMGAAVQGNRLLIPLLYANSYLCGTVMLSGTYDDEFAVFPFDAALSDADLHRRALTYAYPLTALPLKKANGDLSELNAASFKTNGGEIILTALYPEDGFVFARFCNYSDEAGEAVFCPFVGSATDETDLLGNSLSNVADGKLHFHPWEIKTVKIDL